MLETVSRPNQFRESLSMLLAMALVVQPLLTSAAVAAPRGAQVVQGDVHFSSSGDRTVIEASDRSIINYASFDIAGHETVQFIQPSELARVLNKIPNAAPTQIDGMLLANGQVYIVNPAGVYFGKGAMVDVARLVAAAGSISNRDFLRGVDHFTDVRGTVENRGRIEAGAAQLVGQQVANRGLIAADGGLIVLVAGEDVYLGTRGDRGFVKIEGGGAGAGDLPGVENTGALEAEDGRLVLAAGDFYSLAIRHTGTSRAGEIALEGGDGGVVEVAGRLDASDRSAGGVGGNVRVLGDEVAVLDAEIDASGDAGGGEILIGGDFRGKGEVRNASRTYVSEEAEIRADAETEGDGGKVIVWADEVSEFHGSISARGGAIAGDGGFVETSGHEVLDFGGGRVSAGAPNGAPGTWLLDPIDVVIGDPEAASIVTSLEAGTNVEIDTVGTGGVGDITVNSAISPDGQTAGGVDPELWLNADNDVILNAAIQVRGVGDDGDPSTPIPPGELSHIELQIDANNVAVNATIDTGHPEPDEGGSATINASGDVTVGAMINSGTTMINSGGTVTIGGSGVLLTGSGDIGVDADVLSNDGWIVTDKGGSLDLTGATSITNNGSIQTLQGGSIELDSDSVTHNSGQVIETLQGGDITLTADTVTIDGTISATIDGTNPAPGQKVALFQKTNTRAIHLGTKPGGSLGLTTAELDRITAHTLEVGRADGGDLTVTAPINLASVADLALLSGGDVVQEAGATITMDGLGLRAAGAALFGFSVARLAVDITSGPGLFVDYPTDLEIGTVGPVSGVTTASQDITIEVDGLLTVNEAVSAGGAGAVALTAGGGSGTIDANASISSGTGTIALTADDGIDISGGVATDNATASAIVIDADADADAAGTLTLSGGVVDAATNSGSVEITADDFEVTGGAGIDVGGGDVALKPSTAISIGVGAGAGDFSVSDAEIDAISSGGTIAIGDAALASAIEVEDVTAGAKNLALLTDSTIADADADPSNLTTSGVLSLRSNGAIGSGLNPLNVNVGSLTVVSSGGSDVTVTDSGAGGSTRYDVATGGAGTVTLTQAANDLQVAAIATTGDVVLDATAGAITDADADAAVDISGSTLRMTADTGIGTQAGEEDIETAVTTLVASTTTSGDIVIDEQDGLTLGTGGQGVATAGSDIVIEADGLLTVDEAVSAGGAGAVALTAGGGSGTIDANASISSGTGTIALTADDGIDIGAGVATDNATASAIVIDADADVDAVGTLTLSGGVVDAATNSGDVVVTADDFVVSGGATITVGGGDVTLKPSTAISIGLGAGAGNFSVSDAEIDAISSTGTIAIGDAALASAITVEDVTADAKNLALLTDSTIADADADPSNLTTSGALSLRSNGAIGSGANPLNVDVGSLAVVSSGGANVTVTDSGAGGSTRYDVATGGAGTVTLTQAANALRVGAIATTGDVVLDSAGAITDADADAAVDISGSTLTMTSDGAIGSIADPLETDVDALAVLSSGGADVTVTDSGAGGSTRYDVATGGAGTVTLSQAANALQVGAIATTGDVVLDSAGAITDADADAAVDVSGSTLTLVADVGGIGSLGAPLDVAATTALNADTVAGDDSDIRIDSIGDLPVGDVDAGAGDVTLNSTGDIDSVLDNGTPDVAGATVTLLAAVGGIGTDSVLDVAAGTALNADTVTGDDSNIRIDGIGNLPVGLVDAGAGDVELASTGSIVDVDAALGPDISGSALTLDAVGGAGTGADPLETQVALLAADVGSGGIHLDNSGDLEIGSAGGVTGVTSTGGDVDIDVTSSIEVNEPISAPDGSILLDATGTIGFGDGVNTVTAGQNIELNNNLPGPIEEPRLATIFKRQDPVDSSLTFTATNGNFVMGRGQKLSVVGDLIINAGGEAHLGDLSALNIAVDAGADGGIVLLRREPGESLGADGSVIEDAGVDYVANTITLAKQATTDGSQGSVLFSTQSGDPVDNAPPGSFFGPMFEDQAALEASAFIYTDPGDGEHVVDLVGGIGNIITDPSPDAVTPVIEEVTMGTGVLGRLATVSAKSRPIWASEALRAIECSVFEDESPAIIPPSCQPYIAAAGETLDPRLELEAMQAARESYRSLFSESEQMFSVLQSAADDYREEVGPEAVSGKGFRDFVEREPDHLAALGYLDRLAELFGHVQELGEAVAADSTEFEEWRDLLVDDVTPVGLSPEELKEAIEAGVGEGQGELEGQLFASDGLPRSLRKATR